jgi:hypothetical protein
MKTFCTLLFLLISILSQAVTPMGGYISYSKKDKRIITVTYHLVFPLQDSLNYADSINSELSCDNNTAPVRINGIAQLKKQKYYLDCERTTYNWEVTYRATIDLDNAKYAALRNCCNLRIEASLGQRLASITSLASQSSNFYVYTQFENCGTTINETPISTGSLSSAVCQNQPFFYNQGTLDTANFDSLSYHLSRTYSGNNQPVSYAVGYSKTAPLKSSANFPFYLDSLFGDYYFLATHAAERAPITFVIKEWRKDGSNKLINVSSTLKEVYIEVNPCPENKPPVINGPFTHTVCEGSQLCFNITTDDLPYIPPPPAPIPPLDTVSLSWNGAIPKASFVVINPTERLKTGRFCWTPAIGQASNLPYVVYVTARDDACPLNAVTTRSFRITVKEKASVSRDLERINDTMIRVELTPRSDARGTYSYINTLLDENRRLIIDASIGRFKSTGNYLSYGAIDTLILTKSQPFVLNTLINNNPLNCPTSYFDTIYFHTASMTDVPFQSFKVYPNPAHSRITFDRPVELVEVYDLLGNLVLQGQKAKSLAIHTLPNGIYILKATAEDKSFTTRFMKQ